MKKILLILLSSLSLLASNAFITSSELKNKLNNKNLVLLDVTDKQTYQAGHIPGAVIVDVADFRYNVEHYQLMKPSLEIVKIARSLGINNNSDIVIYGHAKQYELLMASYIALSLIVNGAQNVSILDGGYNDWVFENSELVSVTTPNIKQGYFTSKFNKDILVDLDYVKNHINKVPMLESRPLSYFNGEKKSNGVRRLGHIPNSMSSFWKEKFNQDESILSKKELNSIFLTGHKLDPSKEVIIYCTGGLEASMNWYILYKELGFKKAKIYDASMREWGNRDDTPMEL